METALTAPCEKHSHKVVHFVNRTRRDLEDAKRTLMMFDAVLISERLGDPTIKPFMEATFGAAARDMEFPAANRGLFTHEVDSKMRAGWRRNVPKAALLEMLNLNVLDIKLCKNTHQMLPKNKHASNFSRQLYLDWFADKLLDKQLQPFKSAS